MRAVAKTDVGRERDANEDCLLSLPELQLLMVADGMGGQARGEIASELAVTTIASALRECPPSQTGETADISSVIVRAIGLAHERILVRTAEVPAMKGMGTTVVLALERKGALHIAHVGDSRAYLLQAGALRQLTRDHSVVAEMIRAGEITPRQARTHRLRNYLTRNLGNPAAFEVDVQVASWSPNDCLLLCSDGLTSMVEDSRIEKLLKRYREDLERACQELIDTANSKGGKDNISVIVACPQ
jgi:PPM family protein phosphatase